MAALFPKIYDVIDQNPHKLATLRWCEPTSTQGFQQELWDIFEVKPLSPPGALSLLLCSTDPMYELGSIPLRKQILTEHLMQLHKRVDNELVGRRFPRKKVQDLLAGQLSAQNPTPSALMEEVLCELFHTQKVHLNRRSKSIAFYPPDLRLWRSDRPMVFAEEDNTWIFTPAQTQSFLTWLLAKEEDGWKVQWPTADGKLDELKGALLALNVVVDGKQKKDDLARILGRAQAIRQLTELQLKTSPVKLETP